MARNRFDNLDPEKQKSILNAAADEFAERGYEAASINRIIKRSGMSKGSVYYYFEDKADLFATVFERSTQHMFEETGWFSLEVLGPDEFWDAILELTRHTVTESISDNWWHGLGTTFHRLRLEKGRDPAILRVVKFFREWWQTLIVRGQTLGVIRTDLPLDFLVEMALALDEAGHRWFVEQWESSPKDEMVQLVDGWVDLLRDMLDKKNEGWER